ncbi:GNAT family N-acetyltransferase [Paludicola sp. MB14-C6]|uniref:GNAT family N-acetyltransferase n=1 Tax=Paludihabitans sp. MB14-C6 TaxID=3070656 RepID=UPI0027DD078F|nr:GNAT family N-acetyltransferase [Paludicola sp. MB14-C6]WMJ23733.1 GNAT family N-acetyltransferase [Paludicola sp. MB14-C6]
MQTDRLNIRQATIEDFNDYIEMRNSEYVLQYNAMKKLTDEQAMKNLKEYSNSENAFLLHLRENNKVIGAVFFEEDALRYGVNSICLAYFLNEKYASNDYMTEALSCILEFLFEIKKVDVVSARVFAENEASKALLQKLGFIKEGCIRKCVKGYRDIIFDDFIFSILKEEYLK